MLFPSSLFVFFTSLPSSLPFLSLRSSLLIKQILRNNYQPYRDPLVLEKKNGHLGGIVPYEFSFPPPNSLSDFATHFIIFPFFISSIVALLPLIHQQRKTRHHQFLFHFHRGSVRHGNPLFGRSVVPYRRYQHRTISFL